MKLTCQALRHDYILGSLVASLEGHKNNVERVEKLSRNFRKAHYNLERTPKEKLDMTKKELLKTIKQRRLRDYGHACRYETIQRKILEEKVNGKRGRQWKRKWLAAVH